MVFFKLLVFITCLNVVYSKKCGFAPNALLKHGALIDSPRRSLTGGIIEGFEPVGHEFPFVSSITITYGDRLMICTGSIIAPKYVLTAFHCLNEAAEAFNVEMTKLQENMTIQVGSEYKQRGQFFNVVSTQTISLDNTPFYDDILIVELDRKIQFDYYNTGPICLSSRLPIRGESLIVIGHGYRKRRGYVPKIPDTYIVGNITVLKETNNYEFKAGGQDGGTAKGDSGGPSMTLVGNQFFQVGITKSGTTWGNSSTGYYDNGYYVPVAPFCQFIYEATEGTASCN